MPRKCNRHSFVLYSSHILTLYNAIYVYIQMGYKMLIVLVSHLDNLEHFVTMRLPFQCH